MSDLDGDSFWVIDFIMGAVLLAVAFSVFVILPFIGLAYAVKGLLWLLGIEMPS